MADMLVKPGITPKGFRTTVRDYTEVTVVEELAANSYDADASTVLVLLDTARQRLHIIDDGIGFSEQAIQEVAVIGAGEKREEQFSRGKRHYLGSYGVGLKSTLNIAKVLELQTSSEDGSFAGKVEWTKLDEALRPEFAGFPFTVSTKRPFTGTWITLHLERPTNSTLLEKFRSVLCNLPEDEGRFKCYCGAWEDVHDLGINSIERLKDISEQYAKTGKVVLASGSAHADLAECKISEDAEGRGSSKMSAKFFFAGIRDGKVQPLKKGLRGIYLRIHGRLLKHSFTDREYTYPISKWVKFESGLRVELTADWLRDEITLARDTVRFTNDVLQDAFKSALTKLIARFIKSHLKALERKASREAAKRQSQRMELARKRVANDASVTVAGLDGAFAYHPETDGELALLIAQGGALHKYNPSLRIVDYNDQAPFDCMLYDTERAEYIQAELEPTLMEFLQHRDTDSVELLVTWTLGKWRTGATKTGKGGVWKLLADEGATPGLYKLALLSRANSTKVKRHIPVFVLQEALGRSTTGRPRRSRR